MKPYHSNLMRLNSLYTLLWLTVLLSTFALFAYLGGYRVNTSHSYPPGLYQLTPKRSPYHQGDLVLFCPPNNDAINTAIIRGYIDTGRCKSGSSPIIKRIVALEHDRITIDVFIYINGHVLPNSAVLKEDGRQRPLTPFTQKGHRQFVMPKGTVFVYSDYAPRTSFDSRYFGPVPLNHIQGIIKPVWTPSKR
jgi:conjugative transfer signal peptidase TraF